jgi:predicted NAD/FAD-dependent oxidoreductase
VELSIGHRWSAAFPVLPPIAAGNINNRRENYFFDESARFAACGDYFNREFAGRIEGAVMSGSEAARAVVEAVDKECGIDTIST